jgi:hypothetical protein
MAFQQHRTVTAAARLLAPAILLAVATVGGSAIGTPAVACAEPREWDIGVYDSCLQDYGGDPQKDPETWYFHVKWCCVMSGGVYDGTHCVAPPAEQGAQTGPQINLPPGGVPQLTVAPATPGPVAPQTPAPASPG